MIIMNILIDSYKDLYCTDFNMRYERLLTNKICYRKKYRTLPNLEKHIRTKMDIQFENDYNIIKNYPSGSIERYGSIGDIKFDRAYTIEFMGYSDYSNDYSVIFSLQDSLDYILHLLCGADIKNIRKIPNYQILSRGILNQYKFLLNELSFSNLIGYDDKLDNYLTKMIFYNSYDDACRNIINEILVTCNNLLKEIGMKYRAFKLNNLDVNEEFKMRSATISTLCFSSTQEVNDTLELAPYYGLIIKSYSKGEYYDNIEDITSYFNSSKYYPNGEELI